jgi:protein tyrosine phosphatase
VPEDRDGSEWPPTEQQADGFIRIVGRSAGPVYVHCGAGVGAGRTGVMSAAHLVRTGEDTAQQAALRTMAIGSPSIEQVHSVRLYGTSRATTVTQPPALIRGISRLFNAPRRIMAFLWERGDPGSCPG